MFFPYDSVKIQNQAKPRSECKTGVIGLMDFYFQAKGMFVHSKTMLLIVVSTTC